MAKYRYFTVIFKSKLLGLSGYPCSEFKLDDIQLPDEPQTYKDLCLNPNILRWSYKDECNNLCSNDIKVPDEKIEILGEKEKKVYNPPRKLYHPPYIAPGEALVREIDEAIAEAEKEEENPNKIIEKHLSDKLNYKEMTDVINALYTIWKEYVFNNNISVSDNITKWNWKAYASEGLIKDVLYYLSKGNIRNNLIDSVKEVLTEKESNNSFLQFIYDIFRKRTK